MTIFKRNLLIQSEKKEYTENNILSWVISQDFHYFILFLDASLKKDISEYLEWRIFSNQRAYDEIKL
jgi:hypothetical protein